MLLQHKTKKTKKNIQKFKNANFNYAKFVKNYYIEKGEAYISANVSSIDDIISKYSCKDYEWINPEFANYLQDSAYYIPVEEAITIEICNGHFSAEEKEKIVRVIKDYFGLNLGDKIMDLDINKRRSAFLLALGIIGLLLFILFYNTNVVDSIKEFIILLFWFAIWEWADLVLLQRSELSVQKLEAGQLSMAKITFID